MRLEYKVILGLVLIAVFTQVPTVLGEGLSSYWEWNWGAKLYRSNRTSFNIVIINNEATTLNIDNIGIHYCWMPPNAFAVVNIATTIEPKESYGIKFVELVPETTKLGSTNDFAYYIKYRSVGSDIVKSTGVFRASSVEVLQGINIYTLQGMSVESMEILAVVFLVSVVLIYTQRAKISSVLEKHQKVLPYAVFIVCFLVYFSATNLNYQPWIKTEPTSQGFPLTGDEPHYLLATKGLLQGSIFPKDYYPPGFTQHTRPSGGLLLNGQYIFSHPYGLPIISMIPYALGNLIVGSGAYGMMTFINVLVALVAVLIYKTAHHLTSDVKVSVLTSVTFALSTLLFTWSGQLFAEVVLSFFIMLSVYLAISAKSSRSWMIVGLVLGFMSFFKLQAVFIGVGSVIVLLLALKDRSAKKNLLLTFVPVTVLYLTYLTLFIGFTQNLVGGAIQGHEVITIFGISVNKLYFWGLTGILVDSNSGLLFYGPILILSILGIFKLLKIENPVKYMVVFIVVFWFGAISITEYWNGWLSPPGRYMLVILPLLSIPFSLTVQTWFKNKILWLSYIPLFLWGLLLNSQMAFNRMFDYVTTFDAYGGHSKLVLAVSNQFNINLSYFPDFSWYSWYGKSMTVHYYYAAVLYVAVVGLLFLAYRKRKEEKLEEVKKSEEIKQLEDAMSLLTNGSADRDRNVA